MRDPDGLKDALRRIDNASYGAYKRIAGRWRLGDVELLIDHVQGDPFAAPSRIRLRAPTGISPDLIVDRDAREAIEDFLLLSLSEALDPGGATNATGGVRARQRGTDGR